MIAVAVLALVVLLVAYGWPAAAIAGLACVFVFIGTANAAEKVRRITKEDPHV